MDTQKNEEKTVLSTNLPVESVLTIIDIDNKNVEIPIEDAIKKIKNSTIFSLNTTVNAENDFNNRFEHDSLQIAKIDRKNIEKTNDLKFFNVVVEFSNCLTRSFIVPSYVKFYSLTRNAFTAIENIKNRDVLVDYTGQIVKILDPELVPDFEMTDFYNIITIYNSVEQNEHSNKKSTGDYNFYLNGILSSVSYNNFQKKD